VCNAWWGRLLRVWRGAEDKEFFAVTAFPSRCGGLSAFVDSVRVGAPASWAGHRGHIPHPRPDLQRPPSQPPSLLTRLTGASRGRCAEPRTVRRSRQLLGRTGETWAIRAVDSPCSPRSPLPIEGRSKRALVMRLVWLREKAGTKGSGSMLRCCGVCYLPGGLVHMP
jgi:hypothetical protein